MRILHKTLLWLVTTAIPVTIAACYGVAYRFSKTGKVVDGVTGEGVVGIQVSCIVGDDEVEDVQISGTDGRFYLGYDRVCTTLRAEDVDGEANGVYVAKSIPFDEAAEEAIISLDEQQ